LEETLLAALARWGYQEIIPPTFEYLDVLSAGLEPEVIENCYKFVDRTTGRILLLRPDVTAQVARIVAMGMVGQNVPLRLCYRTTVFRYEPEHAGRDREIFQVGAELIGTDDVSTDGEILALMIECLRELGLPSFNISLGHVGFFKALLARTGMSSEGRKRAEHAAARKDLPRLEEILESERVPRKAACAVLEAPGLYGREEVLKRGRTLAAGQRELEAALDRLTQVYRLLATSGMEEHLVLDLGEFRGFDYYDGIAFDVFTKGVGYELGGGGRYNHLIGRFGRQIPSTGFAFDVDRLFQALEGVEEGLVQTPVDFLVSAREGQAERLFQVARLLRGAGYRVVQGKLQPRGTEPVKFAMEEGRLVDASAVVIVGMANVPAGEALVLGHPLTGLEGRLQGKRARKGAMTKVVRHHVKVEDLPKWSAKSPE
jgi:ATP phosphoribosyltransferase regulatory subunit